MAVKHEVVVGNIGTVYSGRSVTKAAKKFNTYQLLSDSPVGRASGQSVTWFCDNEIFREYNRDLAQDEPDYDETEAPR